MTRILVVDDKEENLYYLQVLLRGHGHEVETARHGAEALVIARRSPPELIVSDLLMPVMDGYTLLRHWKADERLRAIPFVVYTATYTQAKDERLALDLGADAFILKPCDPDEFIDRLRGVLETAVRGVAEPKAPAGDERELLKIYSEALIRKLEEKAIELQEANDAMRRDIRERELAEAALRESERRFRQLAENIQEVFWISDSANDRLLYVSPAFETVWGRTVQAIQDDPSVWLAAVHPEDRARVAQASVTLQAHGGYDETFRIVRPDGGIRWIRDRAFPVSDAGGAERVVGTATDVTEVVAAQEALRELAAQLDIERQRLVAAQTVANVGSWEIDLDTEPPPRARAMRWSRQLHHILGTDHATFVPTLGRFIERVHEADQEAFAATLDHAITARQAAGCVHRVQSPDGTVRTVEQRWQVIEGRAGQAATRLLGTCQDITERVQLEEQLRRAQRLESVGQLTGGLAADFNNLLTVILGNAEMLADELGDEPHLHVLAQVVVEAADLGARLTQGLLAFARKQPLEPRVVDLNELVAGMEGILRRSVGERVRMTLVRGPELWPAVVDPAQLDNTLLNLCLNARDAMPKGGELRVATGNVLVSAEDAALHPDLKPGAYVMLAVADTGTGIEPRHLARVFEPFFTTKEKGKGTGLGLATAYGFVKQSGGHVTIESRVGEGTTIRLYLPRAEAGRVSPDAASAAPAAAAAQAETVLLVEDDERVRDFARGQLLALGYQVLAAPDGLQALEILRAGRHVDLLFTDLVMPGMGGRELAEQARALRPGLKVLYTSGYSGDAGIRAERLDPDIPLLPKPYRRDELARRLQEALHGADRAPPA